ncbi:MAG: DUF421 domain-containing protein [Ammonifex sp.]|jgi:uncharacterized membrane protein YcaP (DUF421 family)|nr:MAG: DUF421 domain-containing protein [Ammonifex sp.]
MLAIFFRTVIIYFIVLIMVRLMGKREIGQLSPFDFVVAIIIAEVAALPMESTEIPLLQGLFPLFILVALEIAFSCVALRSRWLRQLVCGTPQVVIHEGKLLRHEMRRARYNLDDLMSQLREKGYPDPGDVAFAILENSGRLSIIPWPEHEPVTRGDLKLEMGKTAGLPRILVADGEILHRNLAAVGMDEKWLENELKLRGLSLKEAFLVTYCRDGQVFVSPAGRNCSGSGENVRTIGE